MTSAATTPRGSAMTTRGAQETFSALAAEIPAFRGLTYARLGEIGALLSREEPAR
jgi:hypothetical protein